MRGKQEFLIVGAATRRNIPAYAGKQLRQRYQQIFLRNIPAYAGKTANLKSGIQWYQEHPRVCGENAERLDHRFESGGTSPRMRGKLMAAFRGGDDGWNIPAYAGKTDTRRLPGVAHEEHPRVCGENQI